MQFKLIAIVLAFTAALAAAADKGCSGGVQEGATVERGRYWYVCQDGQLAPKGCFSDDKAKLNLHETFKSGGYVLECTVDEKGFLSFRYKGCAEGGKEFAAGETMEDGKYWFSCVTEGDKLRLEVSGCVDGGKRFKIGETTEKDSIGYECQRRTTESECSMCPSTCVEAGKKYTVGEKFNVDKFVYECLRDETGKMIRKCVGCVHGSQQLQDGDRYVDGDSVYECAIRQDKTPEHRLVGCHDVDQGTTIERRLHCQWTKGTPPLRYVMACDSKDGDKSATKQVMKCYYGDEKGGYEIEPGCYKIVEDKLMAACTGTGENIKLETFPADKVEEAYKKNVKFCP